MGRTQTELPVLVRESPPRHKVRNSPNLLQIAANFTRDTIAFTT